MIELFMLQLRGLITYRQGPLIEDLVAYRCRHFDGNSLDFYWECV